MLTEDRVLFSHPVLFLNQGPEGFSFIYYRHYPNATCHHVGTFHVRTTSKSNI